MEKKKKQTSVTTEKQRLRTLSHVMQDGVADCSTMAGKILNCHVKLARGYVRWLEKEFPSIVLLDDQTAVSLMPPWRDQGLRQRMNERRAEKLSIARRALEYISPKDVIFLGGGATVFFLAVELARSNMADVFAITNHPFSHAFLTSKIRRLRTIGGTINKRVGVIESSPGCLDLQKQPINKAFLGVEGLSFEKGLCCSDLDAELQRHVAIERAETVIILADYSKFHRFPTEAFLKFSDLRDDKGPQYLIVTDKKARNSVSDFPEGRVVFA